MSAPDLRDQGLRRVSRLTGWLAAAAILAVGAFAGLLARPQASTAKVSADAATTDPGAASPAPSTKSSGGTTATTRSGSIQAIDPTGHPTEPAPRAVPPARPGGLWRFVSPPSVSRWRALGTSAMLLVDGSADLERTRAMVDAEIAAIDDACSRFREDSELSRLNARAGQPVAVSATLADALEVALRAAVLTDGRVDPTLGGELRHLGYDRDFASLPPDGSAVALRVSLPPPWTAVAFDREAATVCLPVGVELDFGATAKALAADHAARAAAESSGRGVLVSLGGDIAVAGPAPTDGWSIRVTDDHAAGPDAPGVDIAIFSGGLATSSTTVRRWRRGDEVHHHLLDPSTGRPVQSPWRTVSVAAGSCVDANLASTAAIVMGAEAPGWLDARGLPSRLVAEDGTVVVVAGWPADPLADDRPADDPLGSVE